MTKLMTFLVTSCLIGQFCGPAQAQVPAAGDPVAGRSLAIKVCTACHVVSADQPYPPILTPPAPNFRAIANRKGTTADSLRAFITTTHRSLKMTNGMPNPELTDEQTANVAAYLMTLRK